MSPNLASADDFEDGSSTAISVNNSSPSKDSQSGGAQKPNAFTELMSRKKVTSPVRNADRPTQRTTHFGRDGLGAYTADPQSFPPSRVVYHNEKFVVINDLYPKATVHLLILPRDPNRNYFRPQEAFDDAEFLEDCRKEEVKVRQIVAEELRRKFGHYSQQDKARITAMESEDPPEKLPSGRDWSKEVISGIHANPSMNHLHIHVLSKDMVSEPMKKRNHYLSFTTDFFVGLEHFPLSAEDHRRHYRHFPGDMRCWRCDKTVQDMPKLKEHLAKELEQWKTE
ncbi:histidine triad nucleotide-binding protein [Zymoseptoria brevis]|uniref:Histidine triad nucleotide-binding protein n=1 Tax=Zymoseptoria brevis TaxID=1047168 RepID=A0A0F4G918_9PEZI|nr:histidine triad nucleotide-binding protein [Zymoseptoria brevis]